MSCWKTGTEIAVCTAPLIFSIESLKLYYKSIVSSGDTCTLRKYCEPGLRSSAMIDSFSMPCSARDLSAISSPEVEEFRFIRIRSTTPKFS